MTPEELFAQCLARGLKWQIEGGEGANGLAYSTAIVYVPDSRPPILAMRTRTGLPIEAVTRALEDALVEVVGRLEVRGGKP